MTLALMLHDAAQLQPLQLRGSFAFTGRLLLVGLPLDRSRISSRARLVPRHQSWPALLLTAALAPTDDRGMDSPVIKGTSDDLPRDQEREFISGFGTAESWQVADADS